MVVPLEVEDQVEDVVEVQEVAEDVVEDVVEVQEVAEDVVLDVLVAGVLVVAGSSGAVVGELVEVVVPGPATT